MYYAGRGVVQNDAKAVLWYQKAADQGNANAQTNLGDMYYAGRGVVKDDTKAVLWLQKAADQGNVLAKNALANLRSLVVTSQNSVVPRHKPEPVPHKIEKKLSPIAANKILPHITTTPSDSKFSSEEKNGIGD